MPRYQIQVAPQVARFLQVLDEKSRRVCQGNLEKLAAGPYPGRGHGDKERLMVRGEELFRMHIGRSYTVFYVILEEDHLVRVIELLPIKQAHKRYGYK